MNFLSLKTGDEYLDLLFTNGAAELSSEYSKRKKLPIAHRLSGPCTFRRAIFFPALRPWVLSVERHKITIEHGRGHVGLPMTYNF